MDGIRSILIKDTTREERIRIVNRALAVCGTECEFCSGCDKAGSFTAVSRRRAGGELLPAVYRRGEGIAPNQRGIPHRAGERIEAKKKRGRSLVLRSPAFCDHFSSS